MKMKKTIEQKVAKIAKPQKFYGPSFLYPTPNDGVKAMGIVKSTRGFYFAGFVGNDGKIHKVGSSNLPCSDVAEIAQFSLNEFAIKRSLERAPEAV